MDRLLSMGLLVRVVERQSFSAAAADLGLPRSSVTTAIKQLEERLGVSLLQRTTRHVTPTLDGDAYYKRCKTILAEVEDAEGALTGEVRGLLRIDVNGAMARHFIIPRLPGFLDVHRELDLYIGEGDRFVDLVREGFDCVIRAGEVADSGLVGRRLGAVREATLASADYLQRHGTPHSVADLEGHRMVGFDSSRRGQVLPLEFTVDGRTRTVTLPCRVTVNNADSYAALARLGFGLIQAPRYRYTDDIAAGRLVEVLACHPPAPMPLTVRYPPSRQMSPRVRAFIDWLVAVVAPQL